jgi:hypothetical protein
MSIEPFVRQNVDAFLDLFQRVQKRSSQRAVRFRTWIDAQTGQLCFEEEGKVPAHLAEHHWHALDLNCTYDSRTRQMRLEEGEPPAFNWEPVALQIFQESMRALQQLEGPTSCVVRMADHLLMSKIWHPVDRFGAEELLLQRPVGTYLCRRDFFAECLEAQLLAKLPCKVSLWTLSVLGAHHQCRDYTLVHLKGTWQIYQGDLSLHEEEFPSLGALITSLKKMCRYPLYTTG